MSAQKQQRPAVDVLADFIRKSNADKHGIEVSPWEELPERDKSFWRERAKSVRGARERPA